MDEELDDAEATSYVVDARELVNMGMIKVIQVFDSAMIDTVSSILSTVSDCNSTAVKIASACRTSTKFDKPRTNHGMERKTKTLWTNVFSFYFGSPLYHFKVYVLPVMTPFIFCHKLINYIGLNYQSLHKVVQSVVGVCTGPV